MKSVRKISSSRSGAVIPALDEGSTIAKIVNATRAYVDDVVVVDDGSTDSTHQDASDAGAIVLTNATPLGQGAAVRMGLAHLVNLGCHDIVTLDGDGAHDPKWIPDLLQVLRDSAAEIAIGSRFINEQLAATIPSCKVAANRFATGLINRLLGFTLTDVASGMRAVTADVVRLPLQSSDFSFAFDLLRSARLAGFRIVESPISARYDAAELHCTNRTELQNLVEYCLRICREPELTSALARLHHAIELYAPFRTVVGTQRFVVHPVGEYHGYIFQIQNDWFPSVQSETGDTICLK